MFDVGGRIVLQDLFSNVLRKLQVGTKQADDAFESLGDQVDATAISATRRIQQLNSQIDALRQKSASGAQITIADVEKFRAAQSELNTITGTMEDITDTTDRATSSMDGLGKAAIGVGTAFAALRFGQTIIDLTTLGAKAQTVQGIFSNLSENLGVDGAKLQRDLQQAARGTVDSVTLITTANRALLAGGAELAGKIPQLFEIARAASLATGQDINYVFETLVRGIVKASPLLIDNADIYIKIGDAVDRWAASQGKTNEQLTETERRMAIANAVISQGSAFMRQMGLDAETAADQMQTMATASVELKTALGELLVSAGVASAVGDVASALQNAANVIRSNKAITDLANQFQELGRADLAIALREANDELARQRAIAVVTANSQKEYQAAVSASIEAVDQLAAHNRQLVADLEATDNAELSLARSFSEGKNAALFQARAITQVSEAVAAFNKARNEIATGKESIAAVAASLADLDYQLRQVAANAPDVPELGTLFGTDTRAIYDYLDAIERISPEQVEVTEKVRESVKVIQEQRTAVLEAARAATDKRAALDLLAQAELGASATAEDLARNMGNLSDAMIAAAIDTGTFGELFATAVDLAAQKAEGLDGIINKLKDAAGQFQALTDFTPGTLKTPALPTDLAFDPSPWYDYLDTIREVGTVQDRLAADSTRNVIEAFEDQQASILETALSIDDYGARLEYLATALLGAGADVLDLVGRIDQLPPALRAAIDPTLTLASAIATLRSEAERPITISAEVSGFEAGLKRIDTLATSLLRGGLSPEEIRSWRTQAVNEYTEAMQDLGEVTTFEWGLTNEAILGGFQENVDAANRASRQIAQSYQTAFTDVASSAGELKGKIESALRTGLEVTAEDIALANTGQYENKALEAARRLAAVAERGFSELEVHPDWAAALEIPPNILAGTEAELKAWAKRTQQDVEDLARPDLIDWDAFARDFQAQLDRETAQGITIDLAVKELSARGLLGGSEDERRKKVAEALGLELPELTIDALFQTQSGAGAALVQDLYGPGADALTVYAEVKPKNTAEDFIQAAGLDKDLEPGIVPGQTPTEMLTEWLGATTLTIPATLNIITPTVDELEPGFTPGEDFTTTTALVQVPVQVDTTTLADQAKTAAGTLADEFVTASTEQQIGLRVASAYATDFTANEAVFQGIGTNAGGVMAGAFVAAVEQGIGNVRRRMAEIIAPEVATILNVPQGALP